MCLAQEKPIQLINPSFEDLPGAGKVPYGWNDCGFAEANPPDIHPSPNANDRFFDVNNRPQEGTTYLGMVVRDDETYEALSQRLRSPMIGGNCYQFSIYLAKSDNYKSLPPNGKNYEQFTRPSVLQIWGGTSLCDTKEMLAESNIINSGRWIRFDFNFTPESDLDYLIIRAFYQTPNLFPYNGHILVDNASAIIPVPCADEIPEPKIIVFEEPEPKEVKQNPTVKTTKKTEVKPEKNSTSSTTKKEVPADLINENLKIEELSVGKKIQLKAIFFKEDLPEITNASYPALEELANFLANNKSVKIEIGGHTNNRPPEYYCNRLSTGRARAVYNYLIEQGIPGERLKYRGYGKHQPIASNDTDEGRRKNQRVEIKVLSMKIN